MKAGESNIKGMLEGTKQFVVPLFQRSYSWKTRQWNTLWDDIDQLYDEEQDYTHFIG